MLTKQPVPLTIPEETVRIAQKVFRKGNRYLALRDALGPIFTEDEFAPLYAQRGTPGVSPVQLALVTIVQYLEDLSDRDAAEAVRSRIDLKYLLGLALDDAGFDYSVLSEFPGTLRVRLLEQRQEHRLLDTLLAACQSQGWVKAGGRQRTDSTHVLAAMRAVNRYELVGETLRATLNVLAEAAPVWLHQHVPAPWYERYGRRIENYRLPKGQTARQAWALTVGQDGQALLRWLATPTTPVALTTLPAVETLRQVWAQQYVVDEQNALRWRQAGEFLPAAELLQTPYDTDVRYSEKGTVTWDGYKVHFTESCDAGTPHLITQVTTTLATTPDCAVTATIQADLAAKALLPAEHLVDGGYTDADLYVASQQEHQVHLVGPTTADLSWQAKAAQGFDHAHFRLDWEQQLATCPGGNTSVLWLPETDKTGDSTILIRFAKADCLTCPLRTQCTRAADGPRSLRIRPQAQYDALRTVRQQQQTPEFQHLYQQRAGIEGTLSQGVRSADLRHARYFGLDKTRLQHLATAAALNFQRLADFLLGHTPALTRLSPFARLATA